MVHGQAARSLRSGRRHIALAPTRLSPAAGISVQLFDSHLHRVMPGPGVVVAQDGRQSPMTEVLHGPTGPGTVMLDIGPGVGALILHTPRELAGHEIEISPAGAQGARRSHA